MLFEMSHSKFVNLLLDIILTTAISYLIKQTTKRLWYNTCFTITGGIQRTSREKKLWCSRFTNTSYFQAIIYFCI